MEVSCAPPKWKFIKDWPANRDLRAAKCSVCVMDFNDGQEVSKAFFHHTATLQTSLETSLPSAEKPAIRLVVAEDLSRDLVELLGSTYDIDPLFFLSHFTILGTAGLSFRISTWMRGNDLTSMCSICALATSRHRSPSMKLNRRVVPSMSCGVWTATGVESGCRIHYWTRVVPQSPSHAARPPYGSSQGTIRRIQS